MKKTEMFCASFSMGVLIFLGFSLWFGAATSPNISVLIGTTVAGYGFGNSHRRVVPGWFGAFTGYAACCLIVFLAHQK